MGTGTAIYLTCVFLHPIPMPVVRGRLLEGVETSVG